MHPFGLVVSFREEAVRPQRATKKKRGLIPLQFQSIAHRGACGKTRVVPHNRRSAQNLRKWETRNACAVVDV
jgi:hypothetical protein